jgi:hypothetical protein
MTFALLVAILALSVATVPLVKERIHSLHVLLLLVLFRVCRVGKFLGVSLDGFVNEVGLFTRGSFLAMSRL